MAGIFGFGLAYADPLLRGGGFERPERPRLIVAYSTHDRYYRRERALFAVERRGRTQVWLVCARDLTEILQWVGEDEVLAPPGVSELDLSPEASYGKVLEYGYVVPEPMGYVHALRTLLVARDRAERPGRAIAAGLLPRELFDEVCVELWVEWQIQENVSAGQSGRNPLPLPDLPPRTTREHDLRHDLGYGKDGMPICCWCGTAATGADLRVFTREECSWKRATSDTVLQNGVTFPKSLTELEQSDRRLEGEELRQALRRWFQVAAVSKSDSRDMYKAMGDFLGWAIRGRVREVVADLDGSDDPIDHRIAAVIRLIGTRYTESALGSPRSRRFKATFIGEELQIPRWIWRNEGKM